MNLLTLPILIPPLAAALSLLAGGRPRVGRRIALVAAAAQLVAGVALLVRVHSEGIVTLELGGWPAPYGITLVADLLSAMLVAITGVIGLAATVYSVAGIDAGRERFGYYPLLQILVMGVSGSFLTGDLFNLYVWFEVMLMASFVLLTLGGEPDQIRGAIKYVTLNLLASALFLAAVGILYGMAGTLNMADLARTIGDVDQPGLVSAVAMLFLVAFGIKAALFPLFFWLPASYQTPPAVVAAVFAGLLTKVGVYALIRTFTLLFVHEAVSMHRLLLVVAGATMVTGVLGAASQYDFRRILSFHIISQIGYMVFGLALVGATDSPALATAALAGSIFFIAHHIIVKMNLFLIAGAVDRIGGTFDLKKAGGLYRREPLLAMLFAVPALSLAGIPPFSGFFAKFSLVQAGLLMGEYVMVGVAMVVGMLTLFSMTKIWAEVFWKPAPVEPTEDGGPLCSADGSVVGVESWRGFLFGPIAALAMMTVAIGLGAEPVYRLSVRAAEQVLDREAYIRAVLGEAP